MSEKKRNLLPEGAAGSKIEGLDRLRKAPLERPTPKLSVRSRLKARAADCVTLLTEHDIRRVNATQSFKYLEPV